MPLPLSSAPHSSRPAPRSPRCAAFVAVSCAVLGALEITAQEGGGNPRGEIPPITRVKTAPGNGAANVPLDRATALAFTNSIDPATITAQSIEVLATSGPLTTGFRFSINRKTVTVTYPDFLPENDTITVRVHGSLILDSFGRRVDADDDGVEGGTATITFTTGPAAGPPLLTAPAVVIGYVFDTNGQPVQGATIAGFDWPRDEQNPHNVPVAVSGADGRFEYTTKSFTSQADYVIVITKADHSVTPPVLFSESLRRIQPIAGGCVRVADAKLQQLAAPTTVAAGQAAVLTDPTGNATLVIPPGALMQNSDISVTILDSDDELRGELPELVARAGCFVDIHGVFGEQTNVPVTLRLPNEFGLPPGTLVPFGKIDHNTMEWSDLNSLHQGPPPAPDFRGVVLPDGSAIEVQFDHFCSICTGYCLPLPCPNADPQPPNLPPGPSCSPGMNRGNSAISLREGVLTESIALPAFTEFSDTFGITLAYSSATADPSVTLQSRVDFGSSRPIERTRFRFEIEGTSTDAYYDFSNNDQKPIGTLFWNGVDGLGRLLPTGSYPYLIRVTTFNADTPVSIPTVFGGPSDQSFGVNYPGLTELSSEFEDRVVLINHRDSEFGAGWRILEVPRVYVDADGTVVLLEGESTPKLFEVTPPEGGVGIGLAPIDWRPPPFDPAKLTFNRADGGYERKFPDGAEQRFGPDGRIERITDRYGRSVTFEHTNGLLQKITSLTGYEYSFAYDGSGKLASISDSAGRTTQFVVDAAGDLTSMTDATGATRTFAYDQQHRLTSQHSPRGGRSEYHYSNGRVVSALVYDNDGTTLLRQRSFAPSVLDGEAGSELAAGRGGSIAAPIPPVTDRIDSMTDGRGVTTLHESDEELRTAKTTDGLGRETTYHYDVNGRYSGNDRPNGAATRLAYDLDGNMTVERVLDGSLQIASRNYEYEPEFSRLTRVVDAAGKEQRYEYDSNGTLLRLIDHIGQTISFSYDDARFPNLPTRITRPAGEFVRIAYDDHGNVYRYTEFVNSQTTSARTTTVMRDPIGTIATFVDALQQTTTMAHDAFGRLTSVVNPLGATTLYEYDEAGCGCSTPNLTRVQFDDSTSISFVYDGLNRLVRRTDQNGNSSFWTYDPESRITAFENRNGEVIQYEYDAARQLVRKRLPNSEQVTFQYDATGNVTAVADPFCTLAYTYDLLERVTSVTTILDLPAGNNTNQEFAHWVAYEYDPVGARTQMRDSFGTVDLDYAYDELHRPTTIAMATGPARSWTLGYDESGRRASITRAPSGRSSTWSYDGTGELASVLHGTTPPTSATYDFDMTGKATTFALDLPGLQLRASYAYDGINSITGATMSPVFGQSRAPRNYTHSPGNRIQSDGVYSYTHDAEGHITQRTRAGSPVTDHYDYDAEGRLRGHRQVADVNGQPITILDVRYGYDPLGRRLERNVNGVVTRYVYDGHSLLHRLDQLNRVEQSFIHGPGTDDPIALVDALQDRVLEYHTDRVGSVIALSDDTGTVVQSYAYDEFGRVVHEADPTFGQPFGFTGRVLDTETGLYFYRARYYDPRIGRFLREDPLGIGGGGNVYAYVQNNPTNLIDPFGLKNVKMRQPEKEPILNSDRFSRCNKNCGEFGPVRLPRYIDGIGGEIDLRHTITTYNLTRALGGEHGTGFWNKIRRSLGFWAVQAAGAAVEVGQLLYNPLSALRPSDFRSNWRGGEMAFHGFPAPYPGCGCTN